MGRSAAAQTPDEINEADYSGSVDGDAEERMSEAAMVGKGESRATEASENVEVGSFGGEGERERGQRGLTVESDTPEASAGQEVGNGFQAVRKIVGAKGRNVQGALTTYVFDILPVAP